MPWIKKFYPIERITFYYALITALYVLIVPNAAMEGKMFALLCARFIIILAIGALMVFDAGRTQGMAFIRQILPLGLIVYWYPETYYIDSFCFPNLDAFFMNVDKMLFGGQPSMAFSRIIPCPWVNEVMNFAYLSFYFIIAGTVIALYARTRTAGYKAAFVLLLSFIVYYIMFIIWPCMGPQFYWSAPDNATPDTWPFRAIMKFLQSMGEEPTGAFPSSHVGITVVCLLLLYFNEACRLFWWILPLAILLIVSTVYIKAHYLIDVFAGLVTAPFLYWLSCWTWKKMNQ